MGAPVLLEFQGKVAGQKDGENYVLTTSNGEYFVGGRLEEPMDLDYTGILLGGCIDRNKAVLVYGTQTSDYVFEYGSEVATGYLIWELGLRSSDGFKRYKLSSPLLARADYWSDPAGSTSAFCSEGKLVLSTGNALVRVADGKVEIQRNPMIPLYFDRRYGAWYGPIPQFSIAGTLGSSEWGIWLHERYATLLHLSQHRKLAVYIGNNAEKKQKGFQKAKNVWISYGRVWTKVWIQASTPAVVLADKGEVQIAGCEGENCYSVKCGGERCNLSVFKDPSCDGYTSCACKSGDIFCKSYAGEVILGDEGIEVSATPEAVLPILFGGAVVTVFENGKYKSFVKI